MNKTEITKVYALVSTKGSCNEIDAGITYYEDLTVAEDNACDGDTILTVTEKMRIREISTLHFEKIPLTEDYEQ